MTMTTIPVSIMPLLEEGLSTTFNVDLDNPEAKTIVPVFSLTSITPIQEEALLTTFNVDPYDLDHIEAKIIPWSEGRQSTKQDISRIHNSRIYNTDEAPMDTYTFFIDGQTLRDGSIIVAQFDSYVMMDSLGTNAYYAQLAKDIGFEPYFVESGCLWADEEIEKLLWYRGLNYGRVPGRILKEVEANLSLGEATIFEMVQTPGPQPQEGDEKIGVMMLLENPAWDAKEFLRLHQKLQQEEIKS